MTDSSSPSGPRTLMRRIAFGAGLLVGTLLVVLLSSFVLIQTEPGKEWLRSFLAALMSSAPDRRIELGKISGTLPWDVRLESLTLGDANGPWLAVDDLVLRWSPGRLLRGEVKIEELRAASLEMKRRPVSSNNKPSPATGLPDIIFNPPPLIIDWLFIPSISFGEEVFGQAATLEALGFSQPPDASTGQALFLQLIGWIGDPSSMYIWIHGSKMKPRP
jgi:translocation and assembly module TamB